MKYTLKNKVKAGFSLVEMLVVIAVIGIIAAIAIPNIGGVTSAASTATQTQNAQNATSMLNNAINAGYAAAGTSADGTALTNGISVGGMSFQFNTAGLTYVAASGTVPAHFQ